MKKNNNKKKLSASKRTVIIILALLALLALAAGALYYYFFIYLKPGFDDLGSNYMASKTPEIISPGSIIEYEIHYMNAGNRPVFDFEIELSDPQGAKLIAEGFEGSYDAGNGKMIIQIGDLQKDKKGKAVFSVRAETPLDDGTIIKAPSMTFHYFLKEQKISLEIENEIVHRIKSSGELLLSRIRLSDLNQKELRIGDTLSIEFDIENAGDMKARNVRVSSSLPAYTDLLESHTLPDHYQLGPEEILWEIAELDIKSPQTFKYRLLIGEGFTDGQDITIDVKAGCDSCSDRTAAASDKVRLYADLSESSVNIQDSDGEYLWAGDTIIITVELKNTGERDAQNVRLLCPMPSGTTYISQSGTSEGIAWSDEIKGLIWDIDRIGRSETKQISFQAQVSGELTGGAKIATDFKLMEQDIDYDIANASADVRGHFSQTILAMGDSLIALSDWVQRLDGMLENTYARTDYNTVASGVGGEEAKGGYKRFETLTDVYKPDIIIIAYGTNDVGDSFKDYQYYLDGLAKKAKATGALVFIQNFGPMITEEHPDKKGYEDYIAACRQIAQENGLPYIDVYSHLLKDPSRYLMDWVHYSPEGSAVVSQVAYQNITAYLDPYGTVR